MERMLVVVFDNEKKAYQGKAALADLEREGSVTVYAHAVVVKHADGTVTVKETNDDGPLGTLAGTAVGSLIGLLGGPVGLAIGATSGLALGAIYDVDTARVGWDFLDNDNDPYDDVQYGHGTGEAKDSSAAANGTGDVGAPRIAARTIGIASAASDLNNCHRHFPELLEAVKRGVMLAGGLPMEFPTISIHESFAHPTSMYLRNLMSMDTEEMIRAQPMDAVVLLGGGMSGSHRCSPAARTAGTNDIGSRAAFTTRV